jgi:hypothetical protein
MSKPNAASASTLDSWAEVRARDRVIRYRRSGNGRAVLVLDTANRSSLWPALMHVLGSNFRVIIPEVPTGNANDEAWLAEFLEGLGTMPVSLIAANDFCVPALDLVLRDVISISHLVLVPDGEADEPGREGAVATGAGPSSVPLLIARRGVDVIDALPTILRFLSGTLSV